jgi:hypothetical protein
MGFGENTERNATLCSAIQAKNRWGSLLTQLNALGHKERRRKIEETYQVQDTEKSC